MPTSLLTSLLTSMKKISVLPLMVHWDLQTPKVKGVFTDIISLNEAFQQDTVECDHNWAFRGFIPSNDAIRN